MISNNIYCILPASETDLVISTENELTRFKVKERIFSNWTKEQGLMAVNFNPSSGIHTRSGYFIFGTGNGAIEIADTVSLPNRSSLNDIQ